MHYQTKRVIVDAVQFNPWKRPWPACVLAWPMGTAPRDGSYGYIPIMGGKLSVCNDDWVLTLPSGEYAVYKPEEFTRFYEPVSNEGEIPQ